MSTHRRNARSGGVCEDQPQILKNQMKIPAGGAGGGKRLKIGTALSGEAALELLEKKPARRALQDLGGPRMSGIEVTRR